MSPYHAWEVLRRIASRETAPLYEHAPAQFVVERLQAFGLAPQRDHFGNLYGRVHRGEGAEQFAIVAHLDHPGLHVLEQHADRVTARVEGGLKSSVLVPGTRCCLYGPDRKTLATVIQQLEVSGESHVLLQAEHTADQLEFGTLGFSPPALDGDLAILPVADDLAQVAVMLLVAERLQQTSAPVDAQLVFTRAEEVGLVGAYLAAEHGIISRQAVVVSLECSRELPGAELGAGPVIRTGDASQSFDPVAEATLIRARQLLQSRVPEAPVQRQLMSGGVCEASAFLGLGYRATGLALPLQNYHNCDPDGHAAPEVISLTDLVTEVELLVALVLGEGEHPSLIGRLASRAAQYGKRLEQSAVSCSGGLPLISSGAA